MTYNKDTDFSWLAEGLVDKQKELYTTYIERMVKRLRNSDNYTKDSESEITFKSAVIRRLFDKLNNIRYEAYTTDTPHRWLVKTNHIIEKSALLSDIESSEKFSKDIVNYWASHLKMIITPIYEILDFDIKIENGITLATNFSAQLAHTRAPIRFKI